MFGKGRERSPKFNDCKGSTTVLGEVREMSAIGTKETIELADWSACWGEADPL
jgi:hypothetical protein